MLKLRDIMTTDIAHATSDMSVREAMDILSKQHISGLPVVDGNRVVGVFSSTDVISLIGEMNDAQPWVSFRRAHTDLEEVLVADVMTS